MMGLKAIPVLIAVSLLLIPSVYASDVTRTITPDPVGTGGTVTVDLDVHVTGGEENYAIDENYPSAFSILADGGGNSSEYGHLKWLVCGECGFVDEFDQCWVQNSTGAFELCDCCLETVADTTYTYQLKAPNVAGGPHDFSGSYMFEGMSQEQDTLGDSQVTVEGVCIPSPEICDGVDNSCEGQTDEGCDDDSDGYCDSSMTVAGTPPVCPGGGGDCDDNPADDTAQYTALQISLIDSDADGNVAEHINPDAAEICDNVDNDCDGNTDYFTATGDLTRSCGPQNETGICQYGTQICSAGTWGSCSGAVYPDVQGELCDTEDDDCNGIIDDVDGGDSVATTHCQCYDGGSPLFQEACPHNGIDDDCNAQVDDYNCGCIPGATQPCTMQDGICQGSLETCPAGGMWLGCDTTTYLEHNSSYESGSETSCDGSDNDCDGETDEGLTAIFYRDSDVDGYGDSSSTTYACSLPSGYASNEDDCNDTNSSINPDAEEVCNGIDDNCNGNPDFLVVPGDLGCTGDVVITADYYDGRTTKFTDIADTTNIAGMILEKSSFGMIEFLQAVNISYSTNLNPPFTLISQNLAKINSALLPFINTPARIHLYNLSFLNPVVLRDSQPCSSSICQIISYSGGNLTFNVTGFTNYSATGSCIDGTLYGQCSAQRPRYCLNGTLVNRAGTCGCPSGYEASGNDCVEEDDGGNGGNGGSIGPVCTSGRQAACKKAGVCEPSYQTCVNGFWGPCEGPDPDPEICDKLDNNCNGLIDDGITCLCTHDDTRVCGPSNESGLCRLGVSTCVNGLWDSCYGAVMPSVELCDKLDNDCNGIVDDNCAGGFCSEGAIPAEGCLCGGDVRTSGYCCSGLYYGDGCPFQWSLLILAGVIILIVLYAVVFYLKSKGKDFTWDMIRNKYSSPEGG